MKKTFIFLSSLFVFSLINCDAQILQKKKDENGKWGFIDEETKEWVIQPQYYDARNFSEGFALVSRERSGNSAIWGGDTTYLCINYGFIDRYNNVITPFKYDKLLTGNFHEGMAVVGIEDENHYPYCGYVDKTGKEVIPLIYAEAFNFSEGLACVAKDVVGIVDLDHNNKTYFETDYQYGGINKAKFGFIDKTGQVAIPFKFGYAFSFNEGLAAVAANEDVFYGFISRVALNGRWGFINKQGEFVIEPQYNEARGFYENLAPVMKYIESENEELWGYIDKKNNLVIPYKYIGATPFLDGVAIVSNNENFGLIDKSGRTIIPTTLNRLNFAGDGVLTAEISKESENGGIVQYNPRTGRSRSVTISKGAYDLKGNVIIPFEEYSMNNDLFNQKVYAAQIKHRSFASYARQYVESIINDWQKKGRYEKTTDWQIRVNEQTRNTKIKELTAIAEKKYTEEREKSLNTNFNIIDYDADNEVFLIRNNEFGNILVPVPVSVAESFQKNWNSITKTPRYFINNNRLALSECTFKMPNGQTFKYSNQASLSYTIPQVEYNFDPIEINSSSTNIQDKQNIISQTVSVGKSDIDLNIPETNISNKTTFAVIIANEEYKKEANVTFALNDGKLFREYCEKTLGIPVNQIHLVENATLNDIRSELDWLKKVADAYKTDANIIFYYNGHGIPDYTSKSAYLLPTDGYGSDAATGYKLSTLYAVLGALPVQSTIVFIDACFSGAQRDGNMIASLRGKGVAIKVDENKPSGNTVVVTAATNDEIAYPYIQKGHGLFTYFLLKKLQETKGDVTLGELSDYVTTQVKQQSIVVNNKSQTPTVIPSATIGENWKNKKLK